LAVDEKLFLRHQLFGVRGRDFDIIADDVVVLDLKACRAAFFGVVLLKRAMTPAAVVAQRDELVNCGA
jgi:hypothetical protein